MSTIVTRSGKGSALTHNEADANFTNLNTDKVEGQSSSVDSEIALFSGTGGKTIKRATSTGILKATSGVIGVAVSGTDIKTVGGTSLLGSGNVSVGTGDVVGPSSSVDAEIALFDSTTGKLLKRATTTGLLKATSGIIGAATAETDYVTPTGNGTLTNKTLEAVTLTNGYTEESNSANSGTAYTIDLANGSVQIITLTGNVTFTFPSVAAGKSFTLILKQDATGGRTVTWPSSAKWPGGTAPTITSTASKRDTIAFVAEGSDWLGHVGGQNF